MSLPNANDFGTRAMYGMCYHITSKNVSLSLCSAMKSVTGQVGGVSSNRRVVYIIFKLCVTFWEFQKKMKRAFNIGVNTLRQDYNRTEFFEKYVNNISYKEIV